MHPLAPNVDAIYRNYAELLLRRHHHLTEGRDEDQEMEQIEEDLSALWEKLDEAQRRSLKGMGSDLNWVRRRGTSPPRGHRAEAVTEEDRRLLADAESRKDWHAALHYLRVCAPVLSVENLARRRAAAYTGVGLSAYADACRALAGHAGGRRIFVHEEGDAAGSARVLSYSSYRDLASADELGWSPEISAEEEYSAFLEARSHDISDEEGRVYGILRRSGGEIRDLGVWQQQIAVFSQGPPDLPWGGHPVWQFHQNVLVGRPPQYALPPKEVLWKMERVGLITPRQRKRLTRGSHA